MKFAVQLYSLRNMAEHSGVESVFHTVSEAGFDGVEFAGFYGLSPKEVAELLRKYRLEAYSAHIRPEEVEAALPYIEACGIRAVFNPYSGLDELDDADRYAALLRSSARAVELLRPRGVTYGYHNHAHEFTGGVDRLQKLLRDASDLVAETDVFWLTVAGIDSVSYLRALGDRLAMVHIKEAAAQDPVAAPQPIVGKGVVDMEGVFAEMNRRGMEWAVLEVEKYPCAEKEYLSSSLRNMKRFAGSDE